VSKNEETAEAARLPRWFDDAHHGGARNKVMGIYT